MKIFLHVLSRMYSSSSTFYAQNPGLEIFDQQKSVNVYLHIHAQREFSAENPLCAASCVTKSIYPRCKFSNLTSTPMYSSRLYAKNPVFEIVHEENVKVYHLHIMYNGKIQQNSLDAETRVAEEFHTSPRFSPAFFHRGAMRCTSSVIIIHSALFFCSLCAPSAQPWENI